MMNWPILSVVTFLPLFGALLIMLLVRGNDAAGARHRALGRAVDDAGHFRDLAGDGLALRRQLGRNSSSSRNITGSGIASYHMGVDGISLPFVILTTALMPICILASWTVDPDSA